MHGPWFPKIVRLSFIRQVSAVMRSYLISRRLLTDFSSGTVRPWLGNNFLIEGHFAGRVADILTAAPQSGAPHLDSEMWVHSSEARTASPKGTAFSPCRNSPQRRAASAAR
jgi:hypothetical protein